MTPSRVAACALLTLRIGYGAALALRPARTTRRWLGPVAEEAGAQVALRGFGVRETLLHVGALVAAVQGAPLRPWLAASIVGDLADIGATFLAREGLPEGSPKATVAVAGGAALLSAAAAAAVDA